MGEGRIGRIIGSSLGNGGMERTVIPLRGALTKIGFFNVQGEKLGITAGCVEYLIGKSTLICGRSRSLLNVMVKGTSLTEQVFLRGISEKIDEVYNKVLEGIEREKRKFQVTDEGLEHASRFGWVFKLPEPTDEDIDMAIEEVSKKVSGSTSLVDEVLRELQLSLR